MAKVMFSQVSFRIWGEGAPTLDGGTLDGGSGYLLWMGKRVPTLDAGGGTYVEWGRGYLPWMGEGVPTLDGGGEGTYLWTGYAACGMPLAASRRRTFLLAKKWGRASYVCEVLHSFFHFPSVFHK